MISQTGNAQVQSGARWFYFIAGLSVVNVAALYGGSDRSFVIGLGITIFLAAVGQALGTIGIAISVVLNLAVVGVFALFGHFAGKGKSWAFLAGMILYALDAIIYLLIQDWMSVGFHGFALVYIFKGFSALQEIDRAAAADPSAPLIPS